MVDIIDFNINLRAEVEAGKYTPAFGYNNPARILAWDAPGEYPIICIGNTSDSHPFKANAYGVPEFPEEHSTIRLLVNNPNENDSSRFEAELDSCVVNIHNARYGAERKQVVSFYARTLLRIARRMFEDEFEKKLDRAYQYQNMMVYERGLKKGRMECLSRLHDEQPATFISLIGPYLNEAELKREAELRDKYFFIPKGETYRVIDDNGHLLLSHWKPSDEHLRALLSVIGFLECHKKELDKDYPVIRFLKDLSLELDDVKKGKR